MAKFGPETTPLLKDVRAIWGMFRAEDIYMHRVAASVEVVRALFGLAISVSKTQQADHGI